MNELKPMGFIYEPPNPEDWEFGSASLPAYATAQVLQEESDWTPFLPQVEAQNLYTETMSCTVFATLNICEILIKRKYGIDVNFADRWLAWASDISPTGANPQKVAETLRKGGVPKQEEWDFTPDVKTFDDWMKTPPTNLIATAREFLRLWGFKHYVVPPTKEAMKDALKFSPLAMSVTAWILEDGIYVQRGQDQHWTVNFRQTAAHDIFDSYDSYIKRYSLDAKPMLVKGYYISKPQTGIRSICKWFPNLC